MTMKTLSGEMDGATVRADVRTVLVARGDRRGGRAALVAVAAGMIGVLGVSAGSGCVPPMNAEDTTAWLRHVPPPASVKRSATNAGRLVIELKRESITEHDTSPEQIAAWAIHELDNGNEWDAALLLAIASYRYHQQALLALNVGFARARQVNPAALDAYRDYLIREALVFNRQDFTSELDIVRGHLFGDATVGQQRSAYLARLAGGGEQDDDIGRRLTALHATMSGRPERLVHTALADAFRRRLIADLQAVSDNDFAFRYLAVTPLDSSRLAALDVVREPFSAALVRNTAPRLPVLRDAVMARLNASRPSTRANAAAILGFGGDPDSAVAIARALEQRLAVETDNNVIDSLRFALIRTALVREAAGAVAAADSASAVAAAAHERLDIANNPHVVALLRRSRHATGDHRTHALLMIQWLPEPVKAALDERVFVNIARAGGRIDDDSRAMALIILRDIAGQRALARESVLVALALASDTREVVQDAAARAIEQLRQLGPQECVTFYAKFPAARPALIARLGAQATLGDLGFLDRAYTLAAHARAPAVIADSAAKGPVEIDVDARDDSHRNAIRIAVALAVANIPGAASRQLLERWFVAAGDDSGLRVVLLATLAMRDDADPSALQRAQLSTAQRLLVTLAFGGEGLGKAIARMGKRLEVQDVMHLAMLAGMIDQPSFTPTLWTLAMYRKPDAYPVDALVRRNVMSALIRGALVRRNRAIARQGAGQ